MKKKLLSYLVVGIFLWLSFPDSALADGIIIPDPPVCGPEVCPPPPCPGPWRCPVPSPMNQLVIRHHHVTVDIQDQIVTTHVDQVFYNPNDWQVEGIYMFPIPMEATVTSFILWVDGQPLEGEVLEAEEARRTYEEIVRTLQDPALLEYADRGALRARVFPIPPGGERRIELTYSQILTADNGLVQYIYPLNTEKFSFWPLEDVSVSVTIQSSGAPIRAVYSPSHEVSVSREGDYEVSVGYEEHEVRPDADFVLYYSLGEGEAFHLLTYRDPADSDPDGFFLLLLAPRPHAVEQNLAKDIILVLDRSGSMEGEKFTQAQEALRYILRNLNPADRFNIIAFSTGMNTYARSMSPAGETQEALNWVDRLSAQGSTDINRALLEAASLADKERPTYVIFLTDGLPTEGVVDSRRILDNLATSAPNNLRLFAFGVGYDVDTYLLDSLTQAHHGKSIYVLPGERLDEILSAFYAKISTPVLTELSLDFGEIGVYDLYPDPLPDLFAGSQIVVVGRYRQPDSTTVILKGEVNGQIQEFLFDDQVFANRATRQATIPRLWATRKIGYLLSQIRLKGPDQETIDQIVKLSIRYGVVTPYTSYLVTEEAPLGAAEQERIAVEQFDQLKSMAPAPAYGQEAVEKAADQSALAGAEAPAAPVVEGLDVVRIVGSRTFIMANGVWTDTAYDPEKLATIKVPFLSEDYFALVAARPDLGIAFGLGPRVIAIAEGIAYEVVETDAQSTPIQIPPTFTTPLETVNPETPPNDPGYTAAPTSVSSGDKKIEPGTIPCMGGFLPALSLSLFVLVLFRKR